MAALCLNLFVCAPFVAFTQNLTTTTHLFVGNGGQFGNPLDNANLLSYNLNLQQVTWQDTIGTSSVQDILITENDELFLAAQDSIVKYSINTDGSLQKVASVSFDAPSTVVMKVYNNLLLVGNFYFPFGSVSYSNNLRIYDRNNLTFIDTVNGINRPVKDIVIGGDTAYVIQNLAAGFTDSAGYVSVVSLSPLVQVIDTIKFSNQAAALGRAFSYDSSFCTINGLSNTINQYNLFTGSRQTFSFNQNLQPGSYGTQHAIHNDTLFLKMNDGIGAINLKTMQLIDSQVIDTTVVAFAYDDIAKRFYITQTDFFSYTKGQIYNRDGSQTGTFPVGSAPETIALWKKLTTSALLPLSKATFDLHLYPNPANSQQAISLFLKSDKTDLVPVRIFNQKGQEVMRLSVRANTHVYLPIQHLPAGLYVVQVGQGKSCITRKLLIK